jgi:hypothetical protein
MSVFVARTSQKLNFVQLQLEQLALADAATGWSRQARLECAQEAVLFHLVSTYTALLREIADHYRLEATRVQCFADLDGLFEQSALQSPERTELASLEQDDSSWLSRLRSAYEACWQSGGEARDLNAAVSSQSEISLVQLPGRASALRVTPQQCRQWYGELAQLAERLRAGMQEW